MKIIKNNYFLIVYILGLCFISVIPNYGAIDRISPQWLALSLINGLSLVYLLGKFNFYKKHLQSVFKFKPLLMLLLFVIWGFLSVMYSNNTAEVIIKGVRWLNIFVSLLISTTFLVNIRNKEEGFLIISIAFTFLLLTQLYFSFSTYFQITSITKYNFGFADLLKGASGNKNITSASILIKVPFLFFLIFFLKNNLMRFLISTIIFCSSYLILLMGSRAAIISLIFLTTIIFFLIVFKTTFKRNFFLESKIYLIIAPLILSFGLFQHQFKNDSSSSIVKRASTINLENTSTQERLRFYKHSFQHILNNPFIGTGLGEWKTKSIEYDKDMVRGYTVPYHVHNDFLEIGAELGIIGLLLYSGIFIYSLGALIPFLKTELISDSVIPFSLILIIGGVIYLIDANLNFPHARPIMQIPFLIYLSLVFLIISSKENYVKK